MTRIYVSIGTNIDRENNLHAGITELRSRFGELTLSSVYESEAIGFAGDPFYNMVAGFGSDAPLEIVVRELHAIEDRHGRRREGPRFSRNQPGRLDSPPPRVFNSKDIRDGR